MTTTTIFNTVHQISIEVFIIGCFYYLHHIGQIRLPSLFSPCVKYLLLINGLITCSGQEISQMTFERRGLPPWLSGLFHSVTRLDQCYFS